MLKELPSILAGACVLVIFGAALTGGQVDESAAPGTQTVAEKSSVSPERERTPNAFEKRNTSGSEIAFNQSTK